MLQKKNNSNVTFETAAVDLQAATKLNRVTWRQRVAIEASAGVRVLEGHCSH